MFAQVCNHLPVSGGRTIIAMSIRHLCVSNSRHNKYLAREGRFMKKLMGNKKGGKKMWFKSQGQPVISSANLMPSISKGSQNFRRIAVLNKLFMQHISDMIGTGSIAEEIVGRGLEISRVKTAPDFNQINVYWIAKGTEDDSEIEQILKKYSWELRHELSQLRVIGIVPPIYFVKDNEYAKLVEVNRILATADFGEDYVPVDAGHRLKAEFSQTTQQQPEKRAEEPESEKPEDDTVEPALPPMRTDVMGLKHAEIMAKIKKATEKSRAPHRHDSSYSLPDSTISVDSRTESTKDPINLKKEDFTKFLMKRQIMLKKTVREKKNYTPELQLYEDEVLENSKIATELFENIDNDNDYIDTTESNKS